jgi:hypothetical protein
MVEDSWSTVNGTRSIKNPFAWVNASPERPDKSKLQAIIFFGLILSAKGAYGKVKETETKRGIEASSPASKIDRLNSAMKTGKSAV